jgi:serine phosphatase RsbU (regulator of sigma subunit)
MQTARLLAACAFGRRAACFCRMARSASRWLPARKARYFSHEKDGSESSVCAPLRMATACAEHGCCLGTPGYAVESVYLPAQQVGGDFFQVLPGEDGSLLIVVGDVSGKGLKAAMTVSTIVGALRGCTMRKPAKVLAYLNRILYGQISGLLPAPPR